MHWQHWSQGGVVLGLLLAVCVGCGGCTGVAKNGNVDPEEEVSELEGEVTIDGSSTVEPISTAVAEAFGKVHPRVRVPVKTSGTGGGFKSFVQGKLTIGDASRPIKPDEFAECQKNGIEFIELPIAFDGLTIVIHPDNDWCSELTVEQIGMIYKKEGAAQSWKELNADWPDEKIEVFSPGKLSGTCDYFVEVLKIKKDDLRSEGIEFSEDDNVLVRGVEGSKGGIGYFGAAYYLGNAGRLKAVKIVNPRTKVAVEMNEKNVENGDYFPYSRPLFIYVNLKELKRPEVRMFSEYYLKHAGEMAKKVGYFPLPAEVNAAALVVLKKKTPGSHFVTSEGKSREGSFLDLFKSENLVNIK